MNRDKLRSTISAMGYHAGKTYELLSSLAGKKEKSQIAKDKELREMFSYATQYTWFIGDTIETIENHISKQEEKEEKKGWK